MWPHFMCAPTHLVRGSWEKSPVRWQSLSLLTVLPNSSLGLWSGESIFIGFLKLNTIDCDSSETYSLKYELIAWHILLAGGPMFVVSSNNWGSKCFVFVFSHCTSIYLFIKGQKGNMKKLKRPSSIDQVIIYFLYFDIYETISENEHKQVIT